MTRSCLPTSSKPNRYIIYPHPPSFDVDSFESYMIDDRFASSQDSWILAYVGKSFQYKEMELEDDFEF